MSKFYIELGTDALVQVVRIDGKVAHLADGSQAWLENLHRPLWLIEAEQREQDARDERETQADALT